MQSSYQKGVCKLVKRSGTAPQGAAAAAGGNGLTAQVKIEDDTGEAAPGVNAGDAQRDVTVG